MKRFLLIGIPLALWFASAIPLVAPSAFDLSRMSDVVLASCLGVFTRPMQFLIVGFTYPHNSIVLTCLAILILPIGPLLIAPILSRSGFDWKSWVYAVVLFFFFLVGVVLVNFLIDATAKAHIYGYKYPDQRYLTFNDFTPLAEIKTNAVVFTQIGDTPGSGYTVTIKNGLFFPFDPKELNPEWALRNMQVAPREQYVESIEWLPTLSRRPSQAFFYCTFDGHYGKGVIRGGQRADIFILDDKSNVFSSSRTDTSVLDWLRWFTGKEQPIYVK